MVTKQIRKQLVIVPWTQEEIQNDIKEYPSLREYYQMIANFLDCKIEDLVWLSSLDENDEEGWEIKSFFPEDSKIETHVWYECYCTSEIGIGAVIKINVNGVKYVGVQNASPWGIYAKKTDNMKECS